MTASKLKFMAYLESLATKACGVGRPLEKMFPTRYISVGFSRQSRCPLISRIASSMLLYVAALELEKKSYRKIIVVPYRLGVLRTSCAYRATSAEAGISINPNLYLFWSTGMIHQKNARSTALSQIKKTTYSKFVSRRIVWIRENLGEKHCE